MKHLLMVEDNPGDVRLVREVINASCPDIVLHVAENSVQAFDFLLGRRQDEKALPDLILLDIKLPIVNGKRILQEIRKDPRWNGIPIIMLTSSSLPMDKAECFALGAKDYLVKPSNWDEYIRIFTSLELCNDCKIHKT
jgi:chemotaxis family two-component system response regulator Rcp1